VAYKVSALEVVNEAKRLAGVTDSKAINWSTAVRLINHSYRDLRNEVARTSDQPWAKSFIFQSKSAFLPRDLEKINSVRIYKDDEHFGPEIPPVPIGSFDSSYGYWIRGGQIGLSFYPQQPILIDYIPIAHEILYAERGKQLAVPDEVDFVHSMDDDYCYYEDEGKFYKLELETNEITEIPELPDKDPSYGPYGDLTVTDGVSIVSSTEGDITDWFVYPDEEWETFIYNWPYAYLNLNGKVRGFEGLKQFDWNPYIEKGRPTKLYVDAVCNDDETGRGVVYWKDSKWYWGGFTENTVIDFPSNTYWAFLEVLLAMQFCQTGGITDDILMNMLNQRYTAFERSLLVDNGPIRPGARR
jgi:hypothetical protein